MIRFIERIIARFRKPKLVPGSKHWTPAEMACFDDMIEGFESLGRCTDLLREQNVTAPSGRKITFRPIRSAVMPAIATDDGQKFELRIPFGTFHLDGRWEPNYKLSLSEQEQREHNESIGALSKPMREFNEAHGTSYVANPYLLGHWHAE